MPGFLVTDTIRVRLGHSNNFSEVWIVDKVGPYNVWHQNGLAVPTIGMGEGDMLLGDGINAAMHDSSGDHTLVYFSFMKAPGACGVGDNGVGTIMSEHTPWRKGAAIEWRVLEVVQG